MLAISKAKGAPCTIFPRAHDRTHLPQLLQLLLSARVARPAYQLQHFDSHQLSRLLVQARIHAPIGTLACSPSEQQERRGCMLKVIACVEATLQVVRRYAWWDEEDAGAFLPADN